MAPSPGASLTACWKMGACRSTDLSGTSAGAMNAVNLAEGMRKGGAKGARDQLAHFWRSASLDGGFPLLDANAVEGMLSYLERHARRRSFSADREHVIAF